MWLASSLFDSICPGIKKKGKPPHDWVEKESCVNMETVDFETCVVTVLTFVSNWMFKSSNDSESNVWCCYLSSFTIKQKILEQSVLIACGIERNWSCESCAFSMESWLQSVSSAGKGQLTSMIYILTTHTIWQNIIDDRWMMLYRYCNCMTVMSGKNNGNTQPA